jgi:hypothetical protein
MEPLPQPAPQPQPSSQPQPSPEGSDPVESPLCRTGTAPETHLWMSLAPPEDGGCWLPLPHTLQAELERRWQELSGTADDDGAAAAGDDDLPLPSRCAVTSAAATARLPLSLVGEELGGGVLELRRVVKWEDSSDGGARWHSDSPYTAAGAFSQPYFPAQLQDLCVRNGIFAGPADTPEAMLRRLASLHILAGNRRVRPASMAGAGGAQNPFPQDERTARVCFCSWCRRVVRDPRPFWPASPAVPSR